MTIVTCLVAAMGAFLLGLWAGFTIHCYQCRKYSCMHQSYRERKP